MKVLCHCITWNRPELLGRVIHCFEQQSDKDVRLIVLDDAGQYHSQEHERWTLVSVKNRYPTMGDKRNAAIEIGLKYYPGMEAIMLFDDDDVYMPNACQSVSDALKQACWARPMVVLEMSQNKQSLRRTLTYKSDEVLDYSICYGGCWAWRLDAFFALGRFESTNSGEDHKLAKPCLKKYGPSANSSPEQPWYYYNRENNSIVGEGPNFYALRGKQKIDFVDQISIGWNGPDMYAMPIEPGIFPRPW